MNIVVPYHITEKYIKEHPEYVFIFSWDFYRKGALGCCVPCVGNANCYSVSVCWKYCASPKYFQDSQYETIVPILQEEFSRIPKDRVIIPFRAIGRRCARLQEFAPKILKYIENEINRIKYSGIKINYLV